MLSLFSWRKVFGRIIFALASAVALGVLTPLNWLPLAVVSCSLLLWHYWQLYRMHAWLNASQRLNPPQASGSWRPIFDGIYYLQKTGRRRRQELIRLLRRFRHGVEALPDGVVVLDSEWHIDWCNRRAQFLLGLRWPTDAQVRLDHLLRQPIYLEYLQNALEGEPVTLPSPLSDDKQLELRLIPYDGQQLLMVRDVTQRLQLEQMRRDFVANISHELRTPLTVMQGYLEMMEAMPQVTDDPMIERAWQSMSQQTTRMNQLVNDLLVLSRLESHQNDTVQEQVDVPGLLNGMLEEAQVLSGGQHEIVLQAEVGVQVIGSNDQMRSAMQNLISNAVKYTPEGTRIVISWCRELDGGVRFAVKDNGEGIAPEHLPRLTERFYRIDNARSRANGGTGLGLAIVKHALLNHDSELQIESQVGLGSSFSFSIPSQRVVLRSLQSSVIKAS